MFYPLKNPPPWFLEALYQEELKTANQSCHDCGVKPGKAHLDGCDTARCLKCGGQRLTCNCEEGGGDIWTGMWPGIKECYTKGYVCFDTQTGSLGFDLNREAMDRAR